MVGITNLLRGTPNSHNANSRSQLYHTSKIVLAFFVLTLVVIFSSVSLAGWTPPNDCSLAANQTLTADTNCDSLTTNNFTLQCGTYALNVSGDVIINGTIGEGAGWINATDAGNVSFGSLTINSGGTYSATSGTTTISDFLINSGTLTNNGGTISGDVLLNANTNLNGNWNVSGKLFAGAGTLDAVTYNIDTNNITIPTGGTYDGGTGVTTVSENWKSSGGLIGKSALDLDGSTEYVNVTDDDSLEMRTHDLTIEGWFKTPDVSNTGTIISKRTTGSWDGYAINTVSGDIRGFFRHTASENKDVSVSGGTVSAGKWYHVAAVYDRSANLNLYVDGKLAGQSDISYASAADMDLTFPLTLGRRQASTATDIYLNGSIARVSIWNRSLSESEIRSIMFQQYSEVANTTGNVGWWQFDEGTSTTVADSSTSSNDGTASDSGVWASGGTFTYGTSTVNMTGDGEMFYLDGFDIFNLEVAQSGKTTTIESDGNNKNFDVHGTLTTGSGTFTDSTQTQVVRIIGSSSPIDGGSTFANIRELRYITGDANITSSTYDYIRIDSEDRYLLGNIVVNDEFRINTVGKQVISDGYNISTETATVTGTLNLTAGSSLIFEDTANAGFGASAGTIIAAGNSTDWIEIISAGGSGVSNQWDGDASMTWDLSYTDIMYGTVWGTSVASTNLDYVNVSSMSTNHIKADDIKLEFTNSNFNTGYVDLQTSGNVVSKNHLGSIG